MMLEDEDFEMSSEMLVICLVLDGILLVTALAMGIDFDDYGSDNSIYYDLANHLDVGINPDKKFYLGYRFRY